MNDLPFPTKTRLALADDIAAGCLTAAITSRCAELAAAGLVSVDVRLTPDGMAWVTRARTAGPGSTSPEPGPGGCTGICDSEPEGEHAKDCPNRTEGDV